MAAAIALLASLGLAHAQTTQQDNDAHHANGAAPTTAPVAAPSGAMGMDKMMGGNMEQMRPMMQQMMRNMMMGGSGMPAIGRMGPLAGMAGLRHIEGQIAFYKAELQITDAQAPQWNAFADALRTNAKRLQDSYKAALPGDACRPHRTSSSGAASCSQPNSRACRLRSRRLAPCMPSFPPTSRRPPTS